MNLDHSRDAVLKRKRNQRGEGARLKVELIEAAMRILDCKPVAELSLRTVAREARVSPPSVYAHFPDARSLTTEVVRECWRQMGEAMSKAVDDGRAKSAFDELVAKMNAYVRYAMETPSRYQLLFALQPIVTEEPRDVPALIYPAFASVMSSMQRIEEEAGNLPMADAMSSAIMILSLAHGRIALAHLAPWRPGNAAERVGAFVAEMLADIFR